MKKCLCGCGQETTIIKETCKTRGLIAGQYHKYIRGHNISRGSKNPFWRGGRFIAKIKNRAYILVKSWNHPRANRWGYVFEHVLFAEKSLGENLPANAIIHHHDGNGTNNNPGNLVVCENNAYHKILHLRQKALKESGSVNLRKCVFCKNYDSLNNLTPIGTGGFCHAECRNGYQRERRAAAVLVL